jgi:hypothetical protein
VGDTQEILCRMFLQSDLSKDLVRKTERHALAEARIYSARKGSMRAKHFRGYFLRRDIVIVRRTPAQSREVRKRAPIYKNLLAASNLVI